LVAVDAAGEVLRQAAMAGPHLIKVNTDEFARAFETSVGSLRDIERRFATLAAAGVELLCITGGARGAVILTEHERFAVRTSVEHPISTAGAGDAFLAGLLRARLRGDGIREGARLASAAAAAAVLRVEAGFIDAEEVEAALERTELLDAADFFAEAHA
jgi:1-phosphofructokinase